MPEEKTTFLESLDPRTKLCGVILLSALTLLTSSSIALAVIVFTLAVGLARSPISVMSLLRQLKRIIWFVLIITLIKFFSVSGTIIVRAWDFYATYEGLMEGLFLSAKIAILFVTSLLFVRLTSIPEMIDAIEALLAPLRRNAGPVILTLTITLNFIPLLIRTAQDIKLAHIARGADVDSSFIKQVRFAASAAVPLFVSAFRSSQHLAEAMEARGYDPARERTEWQSLRMTQRDWLVLVLLCGLTGIATLVRIL